MRVLFRTDAVTSDAVTCGGASTCEICCRLGVLPPAGVPCTVPGTVPGTATGTASTSPK